MNDNKSSSIDEYISKYPNEVQNVLQKIRKLIKEITPNSVELISYGIPTFKLNRKNLVHFGAYKTFISLYPTSSGISHFQAELSGYKISKGTVQFPINKPIPYDLIKRMVEFRVIECS